ncbi:uncharacterized protein LOC107620808 [Arachis ipaensis]|uniref:uncharacterized protein LOC107620808 n=1 Tax=Arachis ipaensis TaxID=130454 RepID=UPI0007AF2A85|nr:uncharacterized protein LOC107620808 [Arachis ipaensis]
MSTASAMPTPMISSLYLLSTSSEQFEDPNLFKSMVGTLQHVTIIRPNLSFVVRKVSQFMHSPLLAHWKALKRTLRYLQGTQEHDLEDRRSVSAYYVFFGTDLVTWSCRKQTTISSSSTEVEFRSLATCEAEITWVKNLLSELKIALTIAPSIFCDNLSIVLLTANPVLHDKTKHFQLDIQVVREKINNKSLQVVHIPGIEQVADILTKSLSTISYERLKDKLRVVSRSNLSLRGVMRAAAQSITQL